MSRQVWSGSGSPRISRPCPPPPPGILPQAQLLGLVTGMNPSITSADTRAYTHERAVMWKTRPEYMARGRTTLQTGQRASSPQVEPQGRPLHYKTSVSCESALESRFLQSWTSTPLCLTKPSHTESNKASLWGSDKPRLCWALSAVGST